MGRAKKILVTTAVFIALNVISVLALYKFGGSLQAQLWISSALAFFSVVVGAMMR